MNFIEQAVTFDCHGESLVGIVTMPESPSATGVVIVVGGPQYRVGSHRQFVQLARRLAAGGHATMRFDYRGMGDSSGTAVTFENSAPDIAAAADALQRACPEVGGIVLWGLCDGASAILLHLHDVQHERDARWRGLVLANPWVRSEATLARTHVKHYYLQRLREPAFWRKLLSGGVAGKALGDLGRNLAAMTSTRKPTPNPADLPFQQRMAAACARFDLPIALLLSGDDYTAKEFTDHASADPAWRAALARGNLTRIGFDSADHTFSDRADQRAMESATLRWIGTAIDGTGSTGDRAVPDGRPAAAGVADTSASRSAPHLVTEKS